MGVKDLWTILSPVCEKKSLWELENKVIAIDLSAWICDSQSVYASGHTNMFLRNLFFRTSHLLTLGAKPVFVMEGDAPDLKASTIRKRLNTEKDKIQPTNAKISRSRLTGLQRQCEELLSSLGIVCVKAPGEAEAYCAHLNVLQIVDAIITQDSDVFLYGGLEVYRNFRMSDDSCDHYSMKAIEEKMGLTRNKLVGYSLLVGSDYSSKVQGLGKTDALNLIRSLPDDQVIDRFVNWRNESFFAFADKEKSKYISKELALELRVREKCLADPLFPDLEVVAEYLSDPAPSSFIFHWNRPSLPRFVALGVKKLDWDEEYCIGKLAPLLGRWHLTHPQEASDLRVVKVVGVPTGRFAYCYRVHWSHYELITLEPQTLVDAAYPDLVQEYRDSKAKGKKRERKKKPELDLSGIVADIVSRPDANPALRRLPLSS